MTSSEMTQTPNFPHPVFLHVRQQISDSLMISNSCHFKISQLEMKPGKAPLLDYYYGKKRREKKRCRKEKKKQKKLGHLRATVSYHTFDLNKGIQPYNLNIRENLSQHKHFAQ